MCEFWESHEFENWAFPTFFGSSSGLHCEPLGLKPNLTINDLHTIVTILARTKLIDRVRMPLTPVHQLLASYPSSMVQIVATSRARTSYFGVNIWDRLVITLTVIDS